MCGIGVVSLIETILKPLACKALKAVSLPEPGPLISTDKTLMPYSSALEAFESVITHKPESGLHAVVLKNVKMMLNIGEDGSPLSCDKTASSFHAERERKIKYTPSSEFDFDNHTVVASVDVEMKKPKNVSIDNSSILEMSSLLPESMFQFAMSEKLTRKLGKMDILSLAAYNREPAPSYPSFLTAGFLTALRAVEDNVVSYGLDAVGLVFQRMK